jgi:xanthine dehydrogenase accessory factor
LVTSRKPHSDLPVPVSGIVSAILAGTTTPHARCVRSGDACNGYFIEAVRGLRTPVYLYGAGHVGREIVRIIDGLAIDLVWIDTSRDRFPVLVRDGVRVVVAERPDQIARDAPGEALHLVMTYSHALDEAICRAVLAGGAFQFLGLIGSQTKRARFVQRMRRAGIAEAMLARLTCPIGVGGITSKSPVAIAIAAAAQIARECDLAAQPKRAERTQADDV